MDCTIRVAETKALISFAVTAKQICVFVFAYAKSRFSHNRLIKRKPVFEVSEPCCYARLHSKGPHSQFRRVKRNHAYCVCKNKGADQLRGMQRLCFPYIDSATPLLYKSQISDL